MSTKPRKNLTSKISLCKESLGSGRHKGLLSNFVPRSAIQKPAHTLIIFNITMKKSLLTLLCAVALLSATQAQVIINEIMYNPPESGTDSLEYIELYNAGNTAVDVSGWSLFGVNFTYPAGSSIAAKGYSVTAVNANAFKNAFGFLPLQWNTMSGLNNSGEIIKILDAASTEVDAVDYKNALPWPVEGAGNGNSIVLCDPNADNSNPANWQACPTATGKIINGKEIKANPNAASGCTGTNSLVAVNDQANVASGVARVISVLGNDLTPKPIISITLSVSPTQGSATINADKTITYQSNAGYCGPDVFQYIICDAEKCDTAKVDITVKCYSARSITQMTGENASGVADSLGKDCELQGIVYGVNLRPLNNNVPSLLFTLIDNASGNGIAVSSLNGRYGYNVKEGNRIAVRGRIGQFSGTTEIQPDSIILVSATNPLIAPLVVTKLEESVESKLIKINNLRLVDPTKWTTGVGASGFNVLAVSDANPLDTIDIRIDRDVETYNAPVPPQPFNLTGIGSQFDGSSPFTAGYQVLPRYNADISTLSKTREADFSANVRLSPNPASDVLLLTTDLAFDRVRILASNGALLQTLENPALTTSIAVRSLPAGTYFARFEKDGAAWTTPFVKI